MKSGYFLLISQTLFIISLLLQPPFGSVARAMAMNEFHMEDAFSCASVTEIPLEECETLVAVYNSTAGPNWSRHDNWLITNTPSNWFGVSLNDYDEVAEGAGEHVIVFNQYQNNLTGHIPPELGNLVYLRYLNLEKNHLSGPIPSELNNLIRLDYLDMSENQISGDLPSGIVSMPNLKQLDFYNNQLTGSISSGFGNLTNLEGLWLTNNRLDGVIPTELGNLSKLQYLDLSGNHIGGSIPSELGSLPDLITLNLGANRLIGAIPNELGNLDNLQYLYLVSNQLTGNIPSSLGSLTNLRELYLPYNQLSGSIPSSLGGLSNLQVLYLLDNQLSGSIPPELGNLTNLQELWLTRNQLNGSIPSSLGSLSNLQVLELRTNHFSGSIPPELSSLTNLYVLNLNSNQLSGTIPPELGNMTGIVHLDLGNNRLSGAIPETLVNLTAIADQGENQNLILDYNRLSVPAIYPPITPTPLESFLALKNPDWYLTQSARADIPTSGGTLISQNGKITVTFSAGAVTTPAPFEIVPQPATQNSPGNLQLASHQSFQINALGTDENPLPAITFASPVTVALEYTEADIDGIEEKSLILKYWDTAAAQWKDASASCSPSSVYTREPEQNRLSVKICHLSEFALLGVKTTNIAKIYLPISMR